MYLYYQQLIKSIIAINILLHLFLTDGNPILKILDLPLSIYKGVGGRGMVVGWVVAKAKTKKQDDINSRA